MNPEIHIKSYQAPPVDEREILRYAGCRASDEAIVTLLQKSLAEVDGRLVYNVCYREFDLVVHDDLCDFGVFSCRSEKLAAHLYGCRRALLMGATVGVELDRLIAKYGRLAPSRALLLQAIGAERIEALCDRFCADYAAKNGVFLRSRFSPGYGDLPLDTQRSIFALLDPERSIGLFLNKSLLMSPSKSVTAIIGVES